tara:strand:- start:302 stop:556 length:255 start_codon:yes stop_codon:yes gene_type:complete
MKTLKLKTHLKCLSVFVTLLLVSCGGNKVVFVPESEGMVRLGPGVKGYVYTWDGSGWTLSRNKVYLPEGWYAGSLNVNEEETID